MMKEAKTAGLALVIGLLRSRLAPTREAIELLYPQDFTPQQFSGSIQAENLYTALSRDYGIFLDHPRYTSGRLNRVLRITGFYEMWLHREMKSMQRKSEASNPASTPTKDKRGEEIVVPKVSPEIQKLVDATAKSRGLDFYSLTPEQRKEIVHLNRLLLEMIYPTLCPKVK